MRKEKLDSARNKKYDEYYTLYADVENEMKCYDKSIFENKIIYCNCDNYIKSNFVKYFKEHFNELKLKKLICSCYREGSNGIAQVYKDGIAETIPLWGDGSFNSSECIDYLKEADIIITNPPFSRWREFFSLLMKYEKKFIILGNNNAVTYKEVFPYIKEGKVWFGASKYNNGTLFEVGDDFAGNTIDVDNKRCISINSITWFTNLKNNRTIPQLILKEKYDEEKYPRYDNYDAVNVDKVKNIPVDYDGALGVPITALKYLNENGELEFYEERYELKGEMISKKIEDDNFGYPKINNERKYSRVIIKKNYDLEGEMKHGDDNEYDFAKPIVDEKEKYARVVIKKKV